MPEEAADDMAAAAFINIRVVIHEGIPFFPAFMGRDDLHMFFQGNLRIGNHGGRKKCMGMVTAATDDTADAERLLSVWCFQETSVIAVNRQTSGMSAGTGQLVKLQAVNKIIIKIWS